MKTAQWCIICCLCAVCGIVIGNNASITYLKIKQDGIALDEALSILVTLWIGWYIPSQLSKALEDKRVLKNHLSEEISSFVLFVKGIKTKVNSCSAAGSITEADKLEINLMFEEADLLLSNLQEQSNIINNSLCNPSIEAYHNYWDFVTGGDLMNQSYTAVDPIFNSRILVEHYKLEIVLKQFAQTIQTHS
jgi:hypothetical protein